VLNFLGVEADLLFIKKIKEKKRKRGGRTATPRGEGWPRVHLYPGQREWPCSHPSPSLSVALRPHFFFLIIIIIIIIYFLFFFFFVSKKLASYLFVFSQDKCV
jgi:hypothetical protein